MGDGGVKEKRVSVEVNLKPDEEEEEDEAITDLFVSFPPIKGIEAEPNPLTVRAVLTGIVLGSLVNASNVYLGKESSCPIDRLIFLVMRKMGCQAVTSPSN